MIIKYKKIASEISLSEEIIEKYIPQLLIERMENPISKEEQEQTILLIEERQKLILFVLTKIEEFLTKEELRIFEDYISDLQI